MGFRQIVKSWRKLALSLMLGVALSAAAATDLATRQAFDRLLDESGLRLASSQNFIDIPISENPVLPYEHAMRHESGELELRFIIRPLNRIEIEYNDPHNAAPEPNHLFPLLFESLIYRLSANSNYNSRTLSEPEARDKFNAQWAALSIFDIDPEFSSDYKNAILLAMHKNDHADAYTLFLYNDHEQAKILINAALATLAFTPTATETR
jgi:hypothetical protein